MLSKSYRVGLLALCAVFASGCLGAAYLKSTRIAETELAVVVSTGYKAFNTFDEKKMGEIKHRYEMGDVDGAKEDYFAYAPKRERALGTLDAASNLVEAISKILKSIEAGTKNPKDLLGYAPQILAAANDVQNALRAAGAIK